MRIIEVFCAGDDPFQTVEWVCKSTGIPGEGSEVIAAQDGVEAPASWSDTAVNIVANKYFYGTIGTPERENSIRDLIYRVTRTITDWGIADGYFDADNGEVFYRELTWLCLHQYFAFNSPVWFNVGIWQHYGKCGTPSGFRWSDAGIQAVTNPYEVPQTSACVIKSVQDNMEDIMRFATDEAMLFKFGSGVGTDLSTLRASCEHLTGGGVPSGPLSFARIYDEVANVVASGGKTRRAALLFSLKDSHPSILEFIQCKAIEEAKAAALIEKGYSPDEAYMSVLYQDSNLSVRLSDKFMAMVTNGGDWETTWVTNPEQHGGPYKAKDLLRGIAEAAWRCGDPGVQFDDTINLWNTCAQSGRINASNPCGEFNFLDDSACNLASLNLMKFRRSDGTLDPPRFQAAVRIAIIAQDILIDRASYPSAKIAQNSHDFRPLGLGYSNLGSFLMSCGLAYDSDAGCGVCTGITALLTGAAYATSAELANKMGPFAGHDDNKQSMMDVMRLHAVSARLAEQHMPDYLYQAMSQTWTSVDETGTQVGFRNAQTTVLAPTGTISFMMDCATMGIEPDIALTKYKKLVGGGTLKLVNPHVASSLCFLRHTEAEVNTIMDWVTEHGTLDGAANIHPDNLPIFDTALPAQPGGRAIPWEAHLKMLAAAQPFISGAISKTINMPADASVEDMEKAIVQAWELGLKSVTFYRDGSKGHQPLNTTLVAKTAPPTQVRRSLPDERAAINKKFSIAGHDGYLTVGLYPDGNPGELFISMSKEGSTISGMMDAFAIAVSLGLQHGVPMSTFIDKFSYMQFEPMGFTKDKDVKMAKSIIDFIFRWLEARFRTPDAPEAPESQPDREATPICGQCGSMTVRSGSCYLCYNCGTSMGCS